MTGDKPTNGVDEAYNQLMQTVRDRRWKNLPQQLVDVVLQSTNLDRDYEVVLQCCNNENVDVRAVGIICLGHLARIHHRFPDQRGVDEVNGALRDREEIVRGQAEAAADDIANFIPGGADLVPPREP